MAFTDGDRVTTTTGNLVGTVLEDLGSGYLLIGWDDADGPVEDEVAAADLVAAIA